MLKKTFLLAISLFSFSLISHAEATKQTEIIKIDRIVAIVDQVVITENELADRIKSVTAQLEKQGTELPPPAILQKQILERMITAYNFSMPARQACALMTISSTKPSNVLLAKIKWTSLHLKRLC